MLTRTIIATIRHADGTPWANAPVTWQLIGTFAGADSTYPIDDVTSTTDAAGIASQALAVPDDPAAAARYCVILPSGAMVAFNLSDGVGSVALEDLVILALTAVEPNSVLTIFDAHTALTTTAHGGIAKPPLAMSFSGNGDIYFVCHEAMTLTTPTEAGTGTLTYTRALAAAPTSFSTLTFPGTLAAGDILKVTLSGISGYKAATLPRSA